MTLSTPTLLLTGALTVIAMMFILWLIHLPIKNAGLVDIGWAYGLGLLALIYGIFGSAPFVPRITITIMAALWSFRLGTHLFQRVVGKPEEGRYQQLRKEWPNNTAFKFLLFFEAQALLDLILSIPFFLVASSAASSRPTLAPLQIIGILFWIAAILGESIADSQLARFKRSATHKDVCQLGLWSYSRHPNYFFEWLVWVAFALFATPMHLGWLAWTAPALMLFFLLKLTGIPATEAQSLRSKGEAYAAYQRTTSSFVPWFKKA